MFLKKTLPSILFAAVLGVGSLAITPDVSAKVAAAPQCDCQNPNLGNYGVLAPDPDKPGEQICKASLICYIPIG